MNTHPLTQELFIVRITQVAGQAAPGQAAWLGSARHVPSGLRRTFESFADLDEFIAGRLNDPGAPADRTAPGSGLTVSLSAAPEG
jgi:hypothetical protein